MHTVGTNDPDTLDRKSEFSGSKDLSKFKIDAIS